MYPGCSTPVVYTHGVRANPSFVQQLRLERSGRRAIATPKL